VKSRLVVSTVVLGLLLTACGSRSSDDGASDDLEGRTTTTSAASDSLLTDDRFGTIDSPCGPGDASGATDVGVTDDRITITSVSDSGGQVGGLNKGIDDSMRAFVEWCNGQGGINGREIRLEMRNAALFEYGTVVTAACEDSLALVGGLAVFDDAGAQLQVDCGLPNVPAAAVSSMQAGADLTFQPLPTTPNKQFVAAAKYFAERDPEAVAKTGQISADVASVDYIATRQREAYEIIGFEYIYSEKAAINEGNWSSFVLDMKNQGIEYLTPISTWEEVTNLQRAMDLQDFSPRITQLETNFYNLRYPPTAGTVAEGAYVQLTTWPFEEADESPAMAEYLEALEAAVPGAEPEQLGVQAWTAALLWATAVQELGSDVTREGLEEVLSGIHEWDGGGLHGTSDPGNTEPAHCFILMRIEDGEFVRQFPTLEDDPEVYEEGNGFACDPDYVVDLITDFDDGVRRSG
jgi:ABC-type branched-subunit amino acid transport system substrate-binding protein